MRQQRKKWENNIKQMRQQRKINETTMENKWDKNGKQMRQQWKINEITMENKWHNRK
jgi:hypothetical protein